MNLSESKIKDEISDDATVLSSISNKEREESETGKEKGPKENLQEVLEEVQSDVIKYTSPLQNIENFSDSSSDSDIIEEAEAEEEINLETCSARDYIEHTVGQILLIGLTILERERPENPIKWLARFLLFNKDHPCELIGKQLEQESFELIKLPEHIKKVIMEDLQDLDTVVVNKLV
ncbi:unnamed protein product [Nezara viridula]|uniref:Uncharacterized protein n=1 Tax=Nezara viridula TaxID=85310 RepID=A0A9P0HF81_NEZVI|nr:unnamed protein product [Nezara viridula]